GAQGGAAGVEHFAGQPRAVGAVLVEDVAYLLAFAGVQIEPARERVQPAVLRAVGAIAAVQEAMLSVRMCDAGPHHAAQREHREQREVAFQLGAQRHSSSSVPNEAARSSSTERSLCTAHTVASAAARIANGSARREDDSTRKSQRGACSRSTADSTRAVK